MPNYRKVAEEVAAIVKESKKIMVYGHEKLFLHSKLGCLKCTPRKVK